MAQLLDRTLYDYELEETDDAGRARFQYFGSIAAKDSYEALQHAISECRSRDHKLVKAVILLNGLKVASRTERGESYSTRINTHTENVARGRSKSTEPAKVVDIRPNKNEKAGASLPAVQNPAPPKKAAEPAKPAPPCEGLSLVRTSRAAPKLLVKDQYKLEL